MDNVLTLFCDPAAPAVAADHVAAAEDAVRALGARIVGRAWLDEGCACDVEFAGMDPDAAAAAARHALDAAPVDVTAQLLAGRRKRLLIADMDSTIVTSETLDDVAAEADLYDRIAPITARAMRGELNFAEALRERLAMLAGTPVSVLEAVWDKLELTAGARTAVRTMAAHGAHTMLVSGGFTWFTERVARAAGFAAHRANVLEVEDGRLAGRAREPILDRDTKLATLLEQCAAHGLAPAEALAVGDGANDLDMIQAAGAGVAFRAKPVVAEAARLAVNHGDLTGLLYIQGYRRAEFVED